MGYNGATMLVEGWTTMCISWSLFWGKTYSRFTDKSTIFAEFWVMQMSPPSQSTDNISVVPESSLKALLVRAFCNHCSNFHHHRLNFPIHQLRIHIIIEYVLICTTQCFWESSVLLHVPVVYSPFVYWAISHCRHVYNSLIIHSSISRHWVVPILIDTCSLFSWANTEEGNCFVMGWLCV